MLLTGEEALVPRVRPMNRNSRRRGGCGVARAAQGGARALVAGAALGVGSARADYALGLEDLGALSIDQLVDVEITSVSKRPEPLSEAPAAIYVISNEDIRRSGATSLVEALRLAPNLQVGRSDAATYGVSARGFNHSTATANKLEVLIDGRSVYTPLYSGVFWDAQDVLLEDVDRIEVISGPGGALWGANAVNGVINVVTRSARATQGGYVGAGFGVNSKDMGLRYGGAFGSNGAFRIYAAASDRDALATATGGDAHDAFTKLQTGFRADWGGQTDAFTLQGDLIHGYSESLAGQVRDNSFSDGNVLGRWTRTFAGGGAFTAQAYYDRASRKTVTGIISTVNTYDVDGQYSVALGSRHALVVGGGYRAIGDDFTPGKGTSFLTPASRNLHRSNLFVQDQIALTGALSLTVGLKLEDNSYTGLEYMPNLRLAWRVSDKTTLWSAVSRAVRTPSRFDTDLMNTGLVAGGPDFKSERLIAYEIGYRGRPVKAATVSISAYYNDYDDLRTAEATPVRIFPLVIANGMRGRTYGLEAWGDFAVRPWWRLSAGVNLQHKSLELRPGSRDIFGVAFAGNDPKRQLSLRSYMNLPGNLELDLGARSVASLPSPAVPSYIGLDARLGWRVSQHVELAIAATNIQDDRHTEFINGSIPRKDIPRNVYASLRWRY